MPKRYGLRPGTRIYKDQYGDVKTFSPAVGEIKTFAGFEGDVPLMQAVETPRTVEDIRKHLASRNIAVSRAELEQALEAFVRHGVIQLEKEAVTSPTGLTAFLEDLDPVSAAEAQLRLRRSLAVVIGAGTIGSAVAVMLAQSGIGTLVLVDEDRVEAKNLGSQVAYSRQTVGLKKAEVLSEFISARTQAYVGIEDQKIKSSGDLTQILEKWLPPDGHVLPVIVNCADEPSVDVIASWVELAVSELGLPIPYIAGGGYAGHLGSIGPTIVPGETSCWSCYAEQVKEVRAETFDKWCKVADRAHGDIARPVFSPLGMLISSLLASEAVWVTTRVNEPMFADRHGEWDVRRGEFRWTPIRSRPGCGCSSESEVCPYTADVGLYKEVKACVESS